MELNKAEEILECKLEHLNKLIKTLEGERTIVEEELEEVRMESL